MDDFYLDDRRWIVRFVLVSTTSWFPQRKVLIPTLAIEGIDWDGARIVTAMTREDVRKVAAGSTWIAAPTVETRSRLHHAQGANACYVQALDGGIGRVEDLLADDDQWGIQYLAVDASQWIGGSVLVPSEWTRRLDWPSGIVRVDLAREELKRITDRLSWVRPAIQPGLARVMLLPQ